MLIARLNPLVCGRDIIGLHVVRIFAIAHDIDPARGKVYSQISQALTHRLDHLPHILCRAHLPHGFAHLRHGARQHIAAAYLRNIAPYADQTAHLALFVAQRILVRLYIARPVRTRDDIFVYTDLTRFHHPLVFGVEFVRQVRGK